MRTGRAIGFWAVAACLFALLGSACGKGGDETGASQRPVVGIAYGTAGKRDESYSQAASKGVSVAKQAFQLTVREIEPAQLSDLEPALLALSRSKPKLVIAISYFYTEPLKRIAPQFRDVKYIIIDGKVEGFDNVQSVLFREEEGSFLVGALAAMKSKQRKVGVVAAMNIPILNKFVAGYECGAKTIDPSTQTFVGYIGTGPESYSDPLKGKDEARRLIHQHGVDVLYHVAGASGGGVIDAAKETGIWAIGVDSDQSPLAPGTVLTSMLKRVDEVVKQSIQDVINNKFVPGVVSRGIEGKGQDDFVDYYVDPKDRLLITAEMKRRVEDLRQKIKGGLLKVPVTRDKVDKACPPRP